MEHIFISRGTNAVQKRSMGNAVPHTIYLEVNSYNAQVKSGLEDIISLGFNRPAFVVRMLTAERRYQSIG